MSLIPRFKTTPFQDTLLILGAGSSCPYGLPTGQQLSTALKEMLRHSKGLNVDIEFASLYKSALSILQSVGLMGPVPSDLNSVFIYNSAVEAELVRFLESYAKSVAPTIDSFLSRKAQDDGRGARWATIGKVLIALVIGRREKLNPFGSWHDDWIEHLIHKYLLPDYKSFFKSPPSIISFNYDRIFERRIYHHLIEQQGLEIAEARKYVDALEILHVYGDLGPYDEDGPVDYEFCNTAQTRIRVIDEDRSNDDMDKVRERIRDMLEWSGFVYFLGYGFDTTNNRFFKPERYSDPFAEKKVFSTSIGISAVDIRRIKEELGIVPFDVRHPNNTLITHNCLQLIRDYRQPQFNAYPG